MTYGIKLDIDPGLGPNHFCRSQEQFNVAVAEMTPSRNQLIVLEPGFCKRHTQFWKKRSPQIRACHVVKKTQLSWVFFTSKLMHLIFETCCEHPPSRTYWPSRNGWRTSMEDAHLILLAKDYGVFGVFDGHGGGHATAFVGWHARQQTKIETYGKQLVVFPRRTIDQWWIFFPYVS